MQKAFRWSAFLIVLSAGLITSCGKKETPPAAESSSPKAETVTPAAPVAKSEAPTKAEPPAPEPAKAAESATAPTSATPVAGEREFVGTAGGQSIVMGLSFASGTSGAVTGWYYVEAQGTGAKQTLSGKMDDGSLVLDQMTGGQTMGTFQLNVDAANPKHFVGLWKGGGRVVPAKLTER